MIGGGAFGWNPGEFTDDSQMAVALAESILSCEVLDPTDLWLRFRAWREAAPDVGIITAAALASPLHHGAARAAHHRLGRSAGNGALMRATPMALAYWCEPTELVMTKAVEQAALTHADPAAGWGAAIYVELMRRAIHGDNPFEAIDVVLEHLPSDLRDPFATVLDAKWRPGLPNSLPNGTVWTCLGQAVWAVRNSSSFEEALVTMRTPLAVSRADLAAPSGECRPSRVDGQRTCTAASTPRRA